MNSLFGNLGLNDTINNVANSVGQFFEDPLNSLFGMDYSTFPVFDPLKRYPTATTRTTKTATAAISATATIST